METSPSAIFLFSTSGLCGSSSRFLDSSVTTSTASCVNSRSCLGCYCLHSGDFPEECSCRHQESLTRIRETWAAVLISLSRNRPQEITYRATPTETINPFLRSSIILPQISIPIPTFSPIHFVFVIVKLLPLVPRKHLELIPTPPLLSTLHWYRLNLLQRTWCMRLMVSIVMGLWSIEVLSWKGCLGD